MSENEDRIDEETASAIIVNTCQLLPKSSSVISDHMHNLVGSMDKTPTIYSVLCGSFAEFYIRPLIPCISDIDFLKCYADTLAFTGDLPVIPTDMSGLFDTIICNKIESCQGYPGFVRLQIIGAMFYNWQHKKYAFKHLLHSNVVYTRLTVSTSVTSYHSNTRVINTAQRIIKGPAVQSKQHYDAEHSIARDAVVSMWCPQWPLEARDWPLRTRNNGWPTTTTICKVMQNGFHVVYAQHRSCRDDKYQFRLSFSFAEAILLQSWTKTQQIVYHLLRFFAKRELIQKDWPKEDEVLCTYHLKTLMLWSCEEKPPEWWDSSSAIAICCELLKKLLEWLKKGYCPNYFIPEANLFHKQWNHKLRSHIEAQLYKFCE